MLTILEDQRWIDVPTLARRAGIRPVRRAYTYLAHLASQGIILRGEAANGRHHYQITPRGLERLAWLRGQDSEKLAPLLGKN